MTTQSVFKQGMLVLAETFGPEKFKGRKAELFLLSCKDTPDEVFLKAIDHLVGNSRFTPTLSDFQEALRTLSRDFETRRRDREAFPTPHFENPKKPQNLTLKKVEIPGLGGILCPVLPEPKCEECRDTGLTSKEMPSGYGKMTYRYDYRCYCVKGQERKEAFAFLPRPYERPLKNITGERDFG